MIVYSVSHSNTGRITQFHFDGSNLIFRQSRLLSLASEELLDPDVVRDMLLLLSWIKCKPIGETAFDP
jgi:hypothetical protein